MTETSDGKYAAGASIISTKILMMDGCVRIREAITAPTGRNGVMDVMSGKKDDLIRREDAIKAVADEHISGSIAEIKDIYNANPFSLTTNFEETLLSIYYSIKDIPAVKMVRCKECVYRYEAQYGISHKWCDRTAGAVFTVTDDGYCAWGERKEPQTADGDGEVSAR